MLPLIVNNRSLSTHPPPHDPPRRDWYLLIYASCPSNSGRSCLAVPSAVTKRGRLATMCDGGGPCSKPAQSPRTQPAETTWTEDPVAQDHRYYPEEYRECSVCKLPPPMPCLLTKHPRAKSITEFLGWVHFQHEVPPTPLFFPFPCLSAF